jgi:hypothetical protein
VVDGHFSSSVCFPPVLIPDNNKTMCRSHFNSPTDGLYNELHVAHPPKVRSPIENPFLLSRSMTALYTLQSASELCRTPN